MHPETLDFDTIVVGAGIVGSGCAYKIAESGRRTLLLEQFSLGHVHGSSHGASRIIRCTHSDPTFLPFVLDAFQEWDKLRQIDGRGDPLVIKNGMLTMDVDWAQTRIRASVLSRFGVRHEVLRGGAAIQKRFPQLVDYDEGWSAVYEPGGGSILAENCLKAVQRQFLAQGKTRATLKAEEPVLDIVSREAPATEAHHPDEHPLPATAFVEVTTSKGKYTAQNVVVAVGGWLPRLLPGLPLKTSPHVIGVNFWRVKSRPELFRPESGFPTLVISDEHGQELFALPCIDYPDAVKFAIHMGMPVEDLDQKMAQQLPDWMLLIPARHIAKHLPDLDCSEPLIRSTCVYTMTDDLNFIVDQHPRHANIFIAGGFSGTGFKYALTFGKIMAKWVNGRPETEFDMSAFRLDRKIDQQLQRARL